jgi:hypothetical protein
MKRAEKTDRKYFYVSYVAFNYGRLTETASNTLWKNICSTGKS